MIKLSYYREPRYITTKFEHGWRRSALMRAVMELTDKRMGKPIPVYSSFNFIEWVYKNLNHTEKIFFQENAFENVIYKMVVIISGIVVLKKYFVLI